MPYLCREIDRLLQTKPTDEVNVKYFKSKICQNYLILRNIPEPMSMKDKREAVLKQIQTMTNDRNEDDEVSGQPLLLSRCKLIANIMIAIYSKNLN